MAFSGTDPINAKQRFFHAVAVHASVYNLAVAFFSWLNQQGGRPDLQVVELENGTATAQVICGAAATLRALVLVKSTTTAAFAKLSDHATDFSSSAVTVLIKQAAVGAAAVFYPGGLAHGTGITYESHTTCDGSTTSAAGDGAIGVALISQ